MTLGRSSIGVTVGILIVLLAQPSYGDVVLTGLLQQGTEPNGATAGSPIWNTLGDEVSFANLYLTQPNAGYTAAFLNHGNGAGVSIAYTLAPGSYEFYFFSDAFPNNNPGDYGLNLFFDGNSINPGIAAYSAAGVSSADAVQAGLNTLSLNGDNSHLVSAPGTLSYAASGLNVTLTGYGYGLPGVFGGPAVDRVSNLDDVPDGDLDGVGWFSVTVTSVPEPGATALLIVALCALRIRPSREETRRGERTQYLIVRRVSP